MSNGRENNLPNQPENQEDILKVEEVEFSFSPIAVIEAIMSRFRDNLCEKEIR